MYFQPLRHVLAIGKMLSFMETLSPAQRITFEAMTTTAVPMAVEPPPSPPPDARVFYNKEKKGRASESEVLVLTTLLALYLDPEVLDKWLLTVEKEASNINDMWVAPKGGAWSNAAPIMNLQDRSPGILSSLDAAIGSALTSGNSVIETVIAVTKSGRLAAPLDIPRADVVNYINQVLKKGLRGPKRDRSGSASPRQVSAIPAIAALLSVQKRLLRSEIARLRVEPTTCRELSKAELLE